MSEKKSIIEYIESFDLEAYKNTYGTLFSKYNVFFCKKWNEEEEYNKEDIVIYVKNYIKNIFESKIDNNKGNIPADNDNWSKQEVDALKYITDEEIKTQLEVAIGYFANFCYGIYTNMTPLLVDFFENFLGLVILSSTNDSTSGVVLSESIDGMSISKDVNEFVKEFPLFDNVFGTKCYMLYTLLFANNIRNMGCINNETYNYD